MNIKDFKWTEKRFGTTFANILKKLGGLSKDTTDGSIEYKDDQGNITKLVTDSTFSSLLAKNGLIEVKWQQLKDKRDNGQLIPGSLYRITDYNCTTTQENTQSAGHQFDIVLLALSENKLAEEGWAMMHDNIYDVTFADGTRRKCYLYLFKDDDGEQYNIVYADTLIGYTGYIEDGDIVNIDEENKTASVNLVQDFEIENLPYNYFQNSNLSAWKVWYCLDNDTSRFAWADDRLILHEIMISGSPQDYIRTPESDLTIDGVKYYAWVWSSSPEFTLSETPKHGDVLYGNFGGMQEIGEVDKVFTNGRGVIYRLIDEWGNDVGYDFKNIQHKKNITDGLIDQDYQGTDMYIYPFNIWINEECQDASLVGNTLADDVNEVYGVCNNIILNPPHAGGEEPITLLKVGLNTTCFLSTLDEDEYYYGLRDSFVDGNSIECAIENSSFIELTKCAGAIIYNCSALKLITCVDSRNEGLQEGAIYIGNKKVLTEDAFTDIETLLNNI